MAFAPARKSYLRTISDKISDKCPIKYPIKYPKAKDVLAYKRQGRFLLLNKWVVHFTLFMVECNPNDAIGGICPFASFYVSLR